jgi:hypothetical protein
LVLNEHFQGSCNEFGLLNDFREKRRLGQCVPSIDRPGDGRKTLFRLSFPSENVDLASRVLLLLVEEYLDVLRIASERRLVTFLEIRVANDADHLPSIIPLQHDLVAVQHVLPNVGADAVHSQFIVIEVREGVEIYFGQHNKISLSLSIIEVGLIEVDLQQQMSLLMSLVLEIIHDLLHLVARLLASDQHLAAITAQIQVLLQMMLQKIKLNCSPATPGRQFKQMYRGPSSQLLSSPTSR